MEENLVVWRLHVLVGAYHTMQQQRFLVCHMNAKVSLQGCAYNSPLKGNLHDPFLSNNVPSHFRCELRGSCVFHARFIQLVCFHVTGLVTKVVRWFVCCCVYESAYRYHCNCDYDNSYDHDNDHDSYTITITTTIMLCLQPMNE